MKNPDNFTNSIIHIVEDSEEKIVESEEFGFLIKLFPGHVNHLVYGHKYQNEKDHLLKPNISKHLELVSFVNSFFPNAMPDILKQHNLHQEKLLTQKIVLENLYPENRMLAYKRCHELIFAPKKSQGYFSLQEQKKEKNEFTFIENIIPPEQI